MVELTEEAFVVRHSVCAVTWDDLVSHLGGVAPPDWHSIICNRAGNLLYGGWYLACRGFILFPLDCTAWILGDKEYLNIPAVSWGLFPFLVGWAPPS